MAVQSQPLPPRGSSEATKDRRAAADPERFQHWAFLCHASDCRYQGAPDVAEALARELQARGSEEVAVVRTGCLSLCGAGPALVTYPGGDVHLHLEAGDATDLAAQLARGKGLATRTVRAPQWYKDQILARLGYFVQMIKRKAAQARGE
jgi:(2Fe-2S) ferredoxin